MEVNKLRGIIRLLHATIGGNFRGASANDAVPNILSSYTRRTWTFSSATSYDAPANSHATSTEQLRDEHAVGSNILIEDSFEDPDEETVMTFPSDLNTISKLNPALFEVIKRHDEQQRYSQSGARQQIADLLYQAHGKATNVTKTALNRLRLDQIKSQLESFGGDSRGTKAVLIDRILKLVEEDETSTSLSEAMNDFGEGLVSRKALARRERLQAKQGIAPHSSSAREKDLLKAADKAAAEAAEFSRVFKDPHEAARLLADARAEDISVIDVRSSCTFTDYMVLATARSRQLASDLAHGVLYEVKKRCGEVAPGVLPVVEGSDDPESDWLVVDCGSVVVHVFLESSRQEYDLEGLWGTPEGTNITRVAPKKTIHTLQTLKN